MFYFYLKKMTNTIEGHKRKQINGEIYCRYISFPQSTYQNLKFLRILTDIILFYFEE